MEILLLEEITSQLAKEVIGQLSTLKDKEPIEVLIFSYGGDILSGNAIIHALKSTGSHITTNVIGVAASMAAIISQAGHKRLISPDAKFNVHNSEMPIGGRNTADNHTQAARTLEAMDAQMIKSLSKANLTTDELRELMSNDVLLSADQALKLGFFDAYSEPVAAVAKLNKSIKDMTKLQSIMKEVKAAALKLNLMKAVLTDDEAARLTELEAIETRSEEEETELAALLAKKAEDAEEAPEAAIGDETGAEILTSDMVSREEFDAYAAKINALLEQILAAIEIVPSEEEMVEQVNAQTTAKLDSVLKAIKSKTAIPAAQQNFHQPAAKNSTRLPSNFIAKFNKKKELKSN